MKRLISVLLAMVITFMLAIPCFAVQTAKFSVKTVSENDSEIVVSVDYEGGSSFSCFDIEMTYNEKKLKVTEAYDGDGLDAFVRDAKRNEGAMVASVINKDSNPIKDSMAVTAAFRVVDGKDIFVAKFKKLSKNKVTADDIKVVFANCATETEKIQTSVSNLVGGGNTSDKTTVITSKAAEPSKKTDSSASAPVKTDNKSETVVSQKTDEKTNETASEMKSDISSQEVSENSEPEKSQPDASEKKTVNTKKIIVIAASAVCALFIIAAVCVYVSKKGKKE